MTQKELLAEVEGLRKENASLRELLWCAHNDGTGYADDGEFQLWLLDFKRDPISLIAEVLNNRALTKWKSRG